MKIVRICGGFGNQLFQYAFFLAIKEKFNETVKLDAFDMESYALHNGFELERIFKLNADYCTMAEKKQYQGTKNIFTKLTKEVRKHIPFINTSYIKEKKHHHFTFQPENFGTVDTDIYYRGPWQSPLYFDDVEHVLREHLVFPEFSDAKSIALCEDIQGQETVAIHIRRGDYLKHKALGGICDLPYYENAIEKIETLVDNPLYVVFSDDIEWCKENIKVKNARFVDWNSGEQSFQDMHLMSLCKHNIIANSSFSWWGAWLNANLNKIVIAPNKWIHYTDASGILPEQWLQVSTK
ncbi:alpha-1,2-fucosyltransferase [Candidatus Colwellia aromaticivorans]|uniref:alpha-1,2-fucosyltransferase n=1 Tax=Candidatus Colwellia aromaticivorans TaxID=2267621 RepID=UPI000DF3078C|nr:alpha-1,2-fucosyltransferase [Candidatus Colwellia aromaticivorans]